MGYLAFDRDAVRLLELSLQRALTELEQLRITDARASIERVQIEVAASVVAGWSERLRAVAACGAMEGRGPARPAGGDLDLALWSQIASATRMHLVHDPIDPDTPFQIDPYLEGAALAAVLRDGDLERLVPDEEVVRLHRQLRALIATTPGRWGFVDRLGEDGLVRLCEHLEARQAELDRQSWPTPDADAAARADAVADLLGTIGAAAVARRDDGGSIDLARVVDAVSPGVAAQLVAGMTLAADELATLTRYVLARWWERSSSSDSALLLTSRAPGDVLLPLVAAEPLASRLLVDGVGDRWELLLRTSRDKEPAEAIILHATDPVAVSSATAGRIVPPVLDYLRTRHHDLDGFDDPPDHSRAWLGSLAGAWLPEFGSRPDAWGWSRKEAEDALAFVIDEDGAIAALSTQLTARLHGIGESMPLDSAGARAALAEVSEIAGRVNALVELERVDDAETARLLSDMTWAVADVIAIGALGLVSLPAGVAGAVAGHVSEGAAVGAMSGLQGLAERHGWLGAPPDRSTAQRDLVRDRDDLTAVQAATVVTATFDALIERGRLPADTPPPPAPTPVDDRSDGGTSERYLDDFQAWQDAVLDSGDLDPELAEDLTCVLHTMLNPAQAAQLGVAVRTSS
ncbi:MAG: hypothetical protein AB7Q42_02105 [Acidimicrobiia bacterium]